MSLCERTGVHVVTPLLPQGTSARDAKAITSSFLQSLFQTKQIKDYVAWYYTPMAIDLSLAAKPKVTVYDCMDELSLFLHAPPELQLNERRLFKTCDLVFTGGVSLYEAKRHLHPRVHAFPSSVDVVHFAKARLLPDSAADQKHLARPRLGFAGVIDERMNLDLIREIADRRPTWQLVMIGPIVKIDPASIPQGANIHWLGMKEYHQLPTYLAGWDLALMPFAQNDSTRYISPTKTPEYLAAGLQVISTPIRDVARTYGQLGLVQIASDAEEFVRAGDSLLGRPVSQKWQQAVDQHLAALSWDKTWCAMNTLIGDVAALKNLGPLEVQCENLSTPVEREAFALPGRLRTTVAGTGNFGD
jgi:UDP-galactopyranose mutase